MNTESIPANALNSVGESSAVNSTPSMYRCLELYISPCLVSFVLIGEYIQYSPLINFRLIIPSNIHLQCLCSTKNEKKQHHEGNMALRTISILTR
jgi:hypothetical protein